MAGKSPRLLPPIVARAPRCRRDWAHNQTCFVHRGEVGAGAVTSNLIRALGLRPSIVSISVAPRGLVRNGD
jgi:hypothetical protein